MHLTKSVSPQVSSVQMGVQASQPKSITLESICMIIRAQVQAKVCDLWLQQKQQKGKGKETQNLANCKVVLWSYGGFS